MIENRILGTELIEWEKIQELQPSDLKNAIDYRESLKAMIRKHGFAKAFDGWEDEDGTIYMIDGHQRKEALRELIHEGENVPDKLPVTLIDAKDKKDAIKLLIDVHNTKQSQINETVLLEWIETEEIEVEEIEIGEVRTEFEYEEQEDEEIDFDNIQGNEMREKEYKATEVCCPECNHKFLT